MEYSGKIDWEVLDYNDCEAKGFFSGIRIGKKEIYLKSPMAGETLFLLFDPEIKEAGEAKGVALSPREFDFLCEVFFTENQRHFITKGIWRVSS